MNKILNCVSKTILIRAAWECLKPKLRVGYFLTLIRGNFQFQAISSINIGTPDPDILFDAPHSLHPAKHDATTN